MQHVISVESPIGAAGFQPRNAESNYADIMALFDLTDDLADTVNPALVQDPDAQFKRVHELLLAVSESADVLTEEYIHLMEQRPVHGNAEKNRAEGALRRIFMALDSYRAKAALEFHGRKVVAKNIADAIVDKLYAQMEKVLVIFLQLLDISLMRILQKTQIDELRKRNREIETAFLLHNMSQSHA